MTVSDPGRQEPGLRRDLDRHVRFVLLVSFVVGLHILLYLLGSVFPTMREDGMWEAITQAVGISAVALIVVSGLLAVLYGIQESVRVVLEIGVEIYDTIKRPRQK